MQAVASDGNSQSGLGLIISAILHKLIESTFSRKEIHLQRTLTSIYVYNAPFTEEQHRNAFVFKRRVNIVPLYD
jgi:hypothetical protein